MSDGMKLLIKPISKEIDSYIKKGNDSFLFGLKGFSAFSSCDLTLKELKNLQLKYPNINLFVLLDKNIFEKDLNKLLEALKELAILKLSGLFFYDLAVLNMTLGNQLDLPLIWNQNFLVTNANTCNYYQTFGVKGAVISSELEISEIEEILDLSKIPCYVNIFGYQLMAFSKRKLVSSYYTYLKEDKKSKSKEHLMFEKGKAFPVLEKEAGTSFLTEKVLDGILYLKNLQKSAYLILNEYGLSKHTFSKVLNIYNQALNDLDNLKVYDQKLAKIIKNRSVGFFDHKTIYKVKNYE